MATRRRRPRSCPDCGQSEILPIRYGMPGPEMMQAAERGEIALGGCCISGDGNDPRWECQVCGCRLG